MQTDSNTGTTTTEFDALGRVTSLTDPLGNETSWTYDAVGQMLSDTNELGDSRSYVYDAGGRLTSRTDRNGRIINFGYDNMSRQTSQQWMDAGVAVNTISTTYNADLNVASISDDDSAYAFTWDADGRLLTVDNTGTVGLPDVVLTNTYDDLGRQTGLSATIDGVADFVNSYSYDANSRVASITQTDGAVGADEDADLHYYRARWYDSVIGRFVSEDPMGFAAGDSNVSRYVGNSVTNASDPTGLDDGTFGDRAKPNRYVTNMRCVPFVPPPDTAQFPSIISKTVPCLSCP